MGKKKTPFFPLVTFRKLHPLMAFAKSICPLFFKRYISGLLRSKLRTISTISSPHCAPDLRLLGCPDEIGPQVQCDVYKMHRWESSLGCQSLVHWPGHFLIVVLQKVRCSMWSLDKTAQRQSVILPNTLAASGVPSPRMRCQHSSKIVTPRPYSCK